jgi:predicted adenylyl cyclase CyaB
VARNVEIKARVADRAALEREVARVADRGPVEIVQDDTFFHCERGRLKLRAFSAAAGELIFYRRPDQAGPKESFYVIAPTSAPDALRDALTLAYGQCGRVRKRRTLYLAGRTRIHLDEVEGLGHFLELEVVLDEHEATAAGVEVAHALLRTLEIDPGELIEGAYVDLLEGATDERA